LPPDCRECAPGYYSPPECRPCDCQLNGTLANTCLVRFHIYTDESIYQFSSHSTDNVHANKDTVVCFVNDALMDIQT
jgi:hypothetical protein